MDFLVELTFGQQLTKVNIAWIAKTLSIIFIQTIPYISNFKIHKPSNQHSISIYNISNQL